MKKHILYWLALGFIIIGCQKEISFEQPSSPAKGSLQDDVSGDCLPKTVNGTYAVGQALGASNTISVQVNVLKTGTYTVYTDTVNGYHFRSTGTFTTLGANTVTLRGNGTPFVAGTNNFVVTFDSTVCDIQVTVTQPGVGTLAGSPNACAPIAVNGVYSPGVALTASNNAVVTVNVTIPGAFNITTDTVAGIWFTFSGSLGPAGLRTATLQANGAIPAGTTLGDKTFKVKLGTSTCTFVVPVVGAGAGTLGGAGGNCTPVTIGGTYTSGVPLTAGNTITIEVNVTTPGAFSITTNTVAGFSFAFNGALTTTGPQNVILQGTGTPSASGVQNFTVTLGTTTCTFAVNVAGPAVYTINCPGVVVNGTYRIGQNLTAANTIVIPITVTSPGPYNISASINGMTFSGSGTLTLASTSITLNGVTSTQPTGPAGTYNLSVGTPACLIPIPVTAVSAAVYTVDCTTAIPDGLYEQGTQLNASNTVDIDVNVTTTGTYTITTTANNGMTFTASGTLTTTGIQTITLRGTGTPTSAGNFNIQVPGPPACTFPLTVDAPLPIYHWQFTVTNAPTTIYRGENDFVDLQPSPAPLPGVTFIIEGSNALGSDYFLIALVDISGTINNGETYSSSATATNAAAFEYDLPSPLTEIYTADPTVTGVTMTFTVTTHNTATKTITGTFSGTAKNTSGQIITITTGTFTGTYP